MTPQLLVNIKAERVKFIMGDSVPSDNILALVESGSFKFTTAGKTYTVGPCEAALFAKGVLFHREVIEPVVVHFFRYRADGAVFQKPKIVFKDKNRIRSTIDFLKRLEVGVFKNDFEYRTRLFLDIVTQYELENGCEALSTPDPIDVAISAITNSAYKKISLPDIGAKAGLSYIQFTRRFKQKTGMTPSEYIATLRLQKAKHLLSDTSLLIREIATLCGFENEYYFSNFFKKQTSISPRTYRALAEEG